MGTYLMTGAAGFIGQRTAALLLEAGHRVVGVDNLNDYYDVRLKEHRLKALEAQESFRFVSLDIEDTQAVAELFATERFDAVFNLAARAGVRYSLENPHVYVRTNVTGTLNLLEAMREHGVKRFMLASTSSLYAGQPMPYLEDGAVNEPISPYAASKKGAESMAYTYHRLFGMDVCICRYFTVYGPAGRPDMSPFRFVRWVEEGEPIVVYGDGEQARDFTYIDDIARGTIATLKTSGFEIINLGGGQNPVSINALIGMIEQLSGKQAVIDYQEAHCADVRETWADIDKAARLLDWQPEVGLEEGLARTYRWYLENREWARSITG